MQLGDLDRDALERRDEHVRALDELRLEALVPADAVLLERADDEGVRGQVERRRAAMRRSASTSGKCSRSIPIGMRAPRSARRPPRGRARASPRASPGSRAKRSGADAESLVSAVELRVPGRPGPPVQVRRGEPVRRLQPARLQRLEVAREEDRLVGRRTAPTRRRDVVAETARGRREVSRVLVDRPASFARRRRRGASDSATRASVARTKPATRAARAQRRRARASPAKHLEVAVRDVGERCHADRGTALVELRDEAVERVGDLLGLVERDARRRRRAPGGRRSRGRRPASPLASASSSAFEHGSLRLGAR